MGEGRDVKHLGQEPGSEGFPAQPTHTELDRATEALTADYARYGEVPDPLEKLCAANARTMMVALGVPLDCPAGLVTQLVALARSLAGTESHRSDLLLDAWDDWWGALEIGQAEWLVHGGAS